MSKHAANRMFVNLADSKALVEQSPEVRFCVSPLQRQQVAAAICSWAVSSSRSPLELPALYNSMTRRKHVQPGTSVHDRKPLHNSSLDRVTQEQPTLEAMSADVAIGPKAFMDITRVAFKYAMLELSSENRVSWQDVCKQDPKAFHKGCLDLLHEARAETKRADDAAVALIVEEQAECDRALQQQAARQQKTQSKNARAGIKTPAVLRQQCSPASCNPGKCIGISVLGMTLPLHRQTFDAGGLPNHS